MNKVLSTYPIKELADEQSRQRLAESMERGNRQAVSMNINGKEIKLFIEAAPQYKSLNMYDSSMKKVTMQSLREGNQEQNHSQQEKQTMKQEKDEGEASVKQKNNRKKSQTFR